MAVTTTSALNSLFNQIYEDAIFVARETNLMTNLVKTYSARGWMSRYFKTRPQITAQSVAENVDYANPTTFGVTEIGSLTPGEVMAQVVITDRDIETDPDDARSQAAREMGGAVATKIDTDLVGVFASFATDKGPGADAAATIAKFATAIAVLRNNLTPNPISIVVHPYAWHDVWVELGQPASQKVLLGDVANQALNDYFVGEWLLSRWYVSANIAEDSGDDVVNGIFNAQAIAFDSRKTPGVEWERDASLRAWEGNIVAGYAYGLGPRPTWGVKYTCDATEPA